MDNVQNLLTHKVIVNLLLEIQSHSGLSVSSKLLKIYSIVLHNTEIFTPEILEIFLSQQLNTLMRLIHKKSNQTRCWKSYDW